MKNYLSIDIGGTKILCVEYSTNFKILKKLRIDTNQFFKTKRVNNLDNLFRYISNQFTDISYEKVGISINCAIKDNAIIYSSLINGGEGVNIYRIAKKYIKFEKFSSDNDVVNMAKAELIYGYGKVNKSFAYINLGTGIRVVTVENGNILRGFNNMAGEVSPMPIWIQERNQLITADNLLAGKGLKKLNNLQNGIDLSAEEIFKEGNKKILNIYIKYLGDFIVNLTYFYNPGTFVFGGSVVKAADIWLSCVKKQYLKKIPKFMQASNFKITSVCDPASIGALI